MKKHVYTIPNGVHFLEELAEYVIAHYATDPISFAQVRILLPNRRSVRHLTNICIDKLKGEAFTLPQIEPLGDMQEEDIIYGEYGLVESVKPISKLEQQCILARLIKGWYVKSGDHHHSMEHMMGMASQLIQWLEGFEREKVTFHALDQLVPEQYAQHWQSTLQFLSIVTEHLPAIYKEKKMVSPVWYRNYTMESLVKKWQILPPSYPVIVAGSTGSIPATRQLLDVVSQLPEGKVILPGLDQLCSQETWEEIDCCHPQFMLKLLLDYMHVDRHEVEELVDDELFSDRKTDSFFIHTFKPAEDASYHQLSQSFSSDVVDHMQFVECNTMQEEAVIVSMAVRKYLEEKDKQLLIVANNTALVRRITHLLLKWDIQADCSMGQNLSDTLPAVFLHVVADMVQSQAGAVELLALFKHPLAGAGVSGALCRDHIRQIELEALRGVKKSTGLQPIIDRVSQEVHKKWLEAIAVQVRPLFDSVRSHVQKPFTAFMQEHIVLAEWLASTDQEEGKKRLWRGDVGKQMVGLLRDLQAYGEHLGNMSFQHYSNVMRVFLQQQTYRQSYNHHPRVSIVSSMESRLLSADVVIIVDANEGSWPMKIQSTPWMNRDMRAKCGLPDEERRIGQGAQDFYQLLYNPTVLITRSRKGDSGPTRKSRWLLKLEMTLKQHGLEDAIVPKFPWSVWAKQLFEADSFEPISPPEPRPPLEMRPRSLSVTQIEKLIRDPYVIYASKILGLRPLEQINKEPGALEFGNFVHDAIDYFIKAYDPEKDLKKLMMRCGKKALGDLVDYPIVKRFWWPKFEHIADWFICNEAAIRDEQVQVLSETWGQYSFDAPAGRFTIKGKTDRIEVETDGVATVIDYKTGQPPTAKDVQEGLSPQLTLEALIALRETDEEQYKAISDIRSLVYWYFKGGEEPVEKRYIKAGLVMDLIEQAEEGVKALITRFDDPNTPYLARPDISKGLRYNDYAQLARIQEWGNG